MKLSQLQLVSSLPIDSLAALTGSLICLSLSPIFIRLSEIEIGPSATAFNRFWIAGVAFALLSKVLAVHQGDKDTQPEQEKRHQLASAPLLIADGFLLSMGVISWAWSLTQSSVANSTMMHNLAPIFTVLGGWLALGKNFDLRFLIGMLVAIAGATLLEINDLFSSSISPQILGDLAALLSAVFFGVHPLIAEQLRTNFNSVTIMTWSSITSFLLLLPITLIAEKQLFPSSVIGWFAVIALALIGQMLGVGLWTYCLKKLSSGLVSLVGLVIPALSAVESWIFLSENLSLLTGISFTVILLGMYLAISSTSAIKSEV
ncbi:DMT family transporter [Roseofilum sp. BLCC_M154]|uniref:DMT family transporter n=1 Tax=Roseofilum acuticapitatum BLCC-M154 TaxID=3022444 RepID=A0ABT7AXV8_9CYAN|nr:DMT family transporter [Roseofilum acuticapitatum]MDJ1171753.1 DMT family transporter [Roseofilum acuticapitatum BLCC-M154]